MKQLLVLGVLVSLAGLPLAARKDYTDVKIQVVDSEKGTPVPRAAVTLKFVRGKNVFFKKDRAEWDVKSDSKGQVELPAIPSGKLRVLVIAKGYQTFGEDFDITGQEQTISVKLIRPVAQYSAHETPEERQKKENEPKKKP